jgi:hypothetical protein
LHFTSLDVGLVIIDMPLRGRQKKNNRRQSFLVKRKRVRRELALPAARGHYLNYADARLDWLALFHKLDPHRDKKTILRLRYPEIKYRTFANRYKTWVDAGKPNDPACPAVQDNRGGHNAAMTPEEEKLCAAYIDTEYLQKNKIVCQADLSDIISAFYTSLYPHQLRSVGTPFKASCTFVTRFMKVHKFYNSQGK